MKECNCNALFRTAEDFLNHLPCLANPSIEELIKALEWYANPENYEGHAIGYEWGNSIELDKGARARKILNR